MPLNIIIMPHNIIFMPHNIIIMLLNIIFMPLVQTPILHTSFASNFFVSKIFCIFLNRFQISIKFRVVLIPIFKFCFLVILAFFETLKPYLQETAQNFEKLDLQKCLRMAFHTYIPVNLYNFLKKHHNRCTLLYCHTA